MKKPTHHTLTVIGTYGSPRWCSLRLDGDDPVADVNERLTAGWHLPLQHGEPPTYPIYFIDPDASKPRPTAGHAVPVPVMMLRQGAGARHQVALSMPAGDGGYWDLGAIPNSIALDGRTWYPIILLKLDRSRGLLIVEGIDTTTPDGAP